MPTMICSPSVTRRAMFSPIRSAPSSAPPAAVSASAIRAPGLSVTNPGLCTRPTTLTTTGSSGFGGAPGVGLADETICTGGSLADATGGRLVAHQGEHRHQHRDDTHDGQRDDTGPPWVGPHSRDPARRTARRGVRQPSRQRRVRVARPRRPARTRDSSAPRRRCSRSAGSSVRMRSKLGAPSDHPERHARRADAACG